MVRTTLLFGMALCLASPVFANDTMAELRTGGLVFVRSDVVVMEKEDLFISPHEVRVAYVFRNISDTDVDTVVAFPMPAIKGDPYSEVAVPDSQSDNLLGFTVEVDGRSVAPELEQKAFAAELDVTAALLSARIPLNPYAAATYEAVKRLPETTKEDWVARGILYRESHDVGQGMVEHLTPFWSMKSTYWWRMTFPAGRAVDVRHRYQPSVGGTTGVTFFYDGKPHQPVLDEYRRKYCVDDAFMRAVARNAAQEPYGNAPYFEHWISYVLTTGGNWASTIQDFRLTIDKEAPENLVSFCGENVRKVGPTTFEMTATDFYPTRDIEILLLRRNDLNRDAALDEEPPADEGGPRERRPLKPQ